jgi:hypothetical protein
MGRQAHRLPRRLASPGSASTDARQWTTRFIRSAVGRLAGAMEDAGTADPNFDLCAPLAMLTIA